MSPLESLESADGCVSGRALGMRARVLRTVSEETRARAEARPSACVGRASPFPCLLNSLLFLLSLHSAWRLGRQGVRVRPRTGGRGNL